LASNKPD